MAQLIVKDNALIEASYSLDVVEQRLILLAILEAREQKALIQAGSLLRIHASSYIRQFNVDRSTAYKALKEAIKGLYEAGFAYSKADEATGKIGHYKSRWVDKIGYIDDLGCVELVFASDVIPLITRLEKRFTEYDIDQISNLQSKYAVRLYELLVQWRSTGKTPIIDLQELRNRLGLSDTEYQRVEALKRRVFDLAIRQINEHTDIIADYEQHKRGREIFGFTFNFKQKKTNIQTTSTTSAKNDVSSALSVSSAINPQLEILNASMSDIQRLATQIAAQIMANGLSERFMLGNETALQMMKRIQNEIIEDTTGQTAERYQQKLSEF